MWGCGYCAGVGDEVDYGIAVDGGDISFQNFGEEVNYLGIIKRYKMLSEVKRKRVKSKSAKVKGSNKVKDHGNDPFFVKKTAESKAFLEKYGFPKDLVGR